MLDNFTTSSKDSHTFNMLSNIITNSTSTNNEADIVYSDCIASNIQNNTIHLELNQRGRGFYLYYHYGNIFKANKVINGNHDESSGVHFLEKGLESTPLIMSDCIFTNCRGGNGAILIMEKDTTNIELKNVTFEKCKKLCC